MGPRLTKGVACMMAGLALILASGRATAEPAPATTLFLDVKINHWPRGLVAEFRLEDGRLSLTAQEFTELGFLAPSGLAADARVWLDEVPGVTFQLDEAGQSIDIAAPFDLLQPERLSITPRPPQTPTHADWGALVSYYLYGEWAAHADDPTFGRFASGDLELRLMAPTFTFGSTGLFQLGPSSDGVVRLDTVLAFDRPEAVTTLAIGDGYSGALAWTRALRFGGVQWRRDFGLRPDLVIQPMPQFTTGVTAPTSLDLYVNGVERYAAGVEPGALEMNDLPIASGVNRLSLVMVDSAGRRREISLPFYAATEMLAAGVTDFSVEAGAVRKNYSIRSWDYGPSFLSGSMRRGVTDSLTAEAHGEAAQGFALAGGALGVIVGHAFVLSGAAMASTGPAGSGAAWSVGVERTGPVINASLRYSQRSAAFQDLGALFGQFQPLRLGVASFSWQLSPGQTLNTSYVLQDNGPEARSEVATAGYSVSFLQHRLRFDLTGFSNLAAKDDWGVTVGLSLSFGPSIASAGVSARPGYETHYVSANGSARDGRLNWRGRITGGAEENAEAGVTLEGRFADLSLRAAHVDGSSAVQGDIAQSLVLFDNRLFLSSRIDDAFAVVDLDHAAGVQVYLERAPVGRTDAGGRLFVNRLRGGEANAISIDPHDLPISVEAQSFNAIAAPRRDSGVVTRFALDNQRAAVVMLARADGKPPPVGADVRLEGAEGTAVLGYGGEAYLRGVKPGTNVVQVTWAEGACRATFEAPAADGGIPRLEATPCV